MCNSGHMLSETCKYRPSISSRILPLHITRVLFLLRKYCTRSRHSLGVFWNKIELLFAKTLQIKVNWFKFWPLYVHRTMPPGSKFQKLQQLQIIVWLICQSFSPIAEKQVHNQTCTCTCTCTCLYDQTYALILTHFNEELWPHVEGG